MSVKRENKQRVNIITTRFDGDRNIITLYRTNRKLAQISNIDLGIDSFDRERHNNKMAYLRYCKDITQDLLINGGISGFYFDSKQNSNGGFPNKFNRNNFVKYAGQYVKNTIESILANKMMVDIQVDTGDTLATVQEEYKDGSVKYGEVMINILMTSDSGQILNTRVPVFIKSGQMCKPKIIIHNGSEMSLNLTNLKAILTDK